MSGAALILREPQDERGGADPSRASGMSGDGMVVLNRAWAGRFAKRPYGRGVGVRADRGGRPGTHHLYSVN